jgi:hypothetical protein
MRMFGAWSKQIKQGTLTTLDELCHQALHDALAPLLEQVDRDDLERRP